MINALTKRNLVVAGASIVWAMAMVFGSRAMLNYEARPAADGNPPARWPQQSRIVRPPDQPTIVVFAHPHCPCTRATVGELALIMAALPHRVTAFVIFARPKGLDENWEETSLFHDAAAIPGVTVVRDVNSSETDLFQAAASGQTLLYDAGGRLLFSGGITASRGHSGDNAGRAAVVSLVQSGTAAHSRTSVYGCSLRTPDTLAEKGDPSWKRTTQPN